MQAFDFVISLFDFWIATHWSAALAMSLGANLVVYVFSALLIEYLTCTFALKQRVFMLIDSRPLKHGQKWTEFRWGILACFIFSGVSLIARELFDGVIPASWLELLLEVVVFTLFYETYSYFVHRLLHVKPFSRWHGTHHRSVRVTPWSAYSVHPAEALLICMSAPLFMLVFPVHLSVIFGFHILGVVFTMVLHSNLVLDEGFALSRMFNVYTQRHAAHHQLANVNFGFVHPFWDLCFNTAHPKRGA